MGLLLTIKANQQHNRHLTDLLAPGPYEADLLGRVELHPRRIHFGAHLYLKLLLHRFRATYLPALISPIFAHYRPQ